MALWKRLRDLDSRVVPGLRRPGESAEDYLRRVADGGPATSFKAADVHTALREYFRERDR